MTERSIALERPSRDMRDDSWGSPELLAAMMEMFPECDTRGLLSELRKLCDEHNRRIRLLFH